MKAIDIHGKPYIMVKDRVIHFNNKYPNGSISTELIPMEGKYAFKAIVIPDVENPNRCFTGHAEEEIGSSQINKTSALENCETSAIGRALGCMGIGVEESFASAEEVSNAVFQQKEVAAPIVSHPDTPKTAVNGIVCPLCSKSVIDKRVWEDGEFTRQTSSKGNKLPAFQCIDNDDFRNPTCKGVIWDVPDDKTPEVLVDDKNLAEAEQLAQQLEEDMPF